MKWSSLPKFLVFHACFDDDNKAKIHLVMENLRDQGQML